MPRKKLKAVDPEVARMIGGLLRSLRKGAGYRAVRDAAAVRGCPAALQTIYAYERGGLMPSIHQLMELVEFYALQSPGATDEVRHKGVSTMIAAITSPAYQLPAAFDLIARLQPQPAAKRKRQRK